MTPNEQNDSANADDQSEGSGGSGFCGYCRIDRWKGGSQATPDLAWADANKHRVDNPGKQHDVTVIPG
jgi:hypothetical protein